MIFLKAIFGRKPKQAAKPQFQPTPNAQTTQKPKPTIQVTTLPDPIQSNFKNRAFRFIAVDVETANEYIGSICQIGIAGVTENGDIETESFLIDPQDDFDSYNIDIHGITPDAVEDSPTFDEVIQVLRPTLERHPLIQHSTFDKRAINAACEDHEIPELQSKWLNSVTIARRAWPEWIGNGGHGLANLKEELGLDFDHHDAEEDARAAAQVVLLAEEVSGKSFAELAAPKKREFEKPVAVEGDQNGPLYGHVAVFTGKISLSRLEAATIAANAGITVKAGVSKKVSLLIVGDQDMTLLAGHSKSSKHRRAEELIAEGHSIRILGETEFLALIKMG